MPFPKPHTVVPTADERELLLRFLNRQREEVVAVAEGLSDDQGRWTPDGALLPVVGVVNHLTHVEWRWVEGRYLQLPFPERTDEFAPDGIGVEQACADYWVQARRLDLRWVLLHLIEETAHHAGHADATRELLDGVIMRP